VAGVNRDLIEDYLAELRGGLRTAPARTAEIVAEAEDHLRESAAARRAGGVGEEAAQRAAITAFGPVKQVIRGHRPPLSTYAAAAALQACLLLGGYLLLSALLGGLLLLDELGGPLTLAQGRPLTSVAAGQGQQPGDPKVWVVGLTGMPFPVQVTAIFGGSVLAAVILFAGYLIVRRHRRRSGQVLAGLPRGLFPLAAAIGLLTFWIFESRGALGFWLGRVGVTGARELAFGTEGAAILLGVGCLMWGLASLTGTDGRVRKAPAVAAAGGGRTEAVRSAAAAGPSRPSAAGRRRRRPGYAAAIGLKAWPLLGSYLLLAALLGGIVLYVDASEYFGTMPGQWPAAALAGGCALAGALLVAGFLIVTRRRQRSGLAPATLPRGPSLLISAIGLLALAVAEYWFFVGDVNGTLRLPEGIEDLVLASQWAVVLVGVGCALLTLASLVRWTVDGRRGVPPDSTDLAPA
jgi:hypothetical protein